MQPEAELIAGSATGSIYDLGYRRYTGPRLGRRHAFRVLFGRSYRWTFGIGRGGSAKIVPFFLAAWALIPAIVVVGVRAFLGDRFGRVEDLIPVDPARYAGVVSTPLIFFVIAQAPELLGRDQRHGTLTLYFSRSLGRTDYAMTKFLALTAALATVVLVPQAVMLVGVIFLTTNVGDGLREALPLVPRVLASAAADAALLAGIALAIAAFTPRRAYASGAIAAVLLVVSGIVQIVVFQGGTAAWRSIALLDTGALMDGVAATVFGTRPGTLVVRSGLPTIAFAIAAVGLTVACVLVLVARYRRIQA